MPRARNAARAACALGLVLLLGGCDESYCRASAEDPGAAILIGLFCSGVDRHDAERQTTAAFTMDPVSVPSGGTVTLDASAAHATRGAISRYEWDVDGIGAGTDPDYEYDAMTRPVVALPFYLRPGAQAERRSIGLRVTDKAGVTATVSRTLQITAAVPVARFTVTPNPVAVGRTAAFDASGSSGASIYTWDFDGDGTYEVGPLPRSVTEHTYATPGDRTVGLTVHDLLGGAATSTVRVRVLPGEALARAAAASRRRAFSARLSHVTLPSNLGSPQRRGTLRIVRDVVARGRLSSPRRGPGSLARFRRARWVARLRFTNDSRAGRTRMRGRALARFPHSAGLACVRIRMHTRANAPPVGRATVAGGRGKAARLRGGGTFTFSLRSGTPRVHGRIHARLGRPRALPRACKRLGRS